MKFIISYKNKNMNCDLLKIFKTAINTGNFNTINCVLENIKNHCNIHINIFTNYGSFIEYAIESNQLWIVIMMFENTSISQKPIIRTSRYIFIRNLFLIAIKYEHVNIIKYLLSISVKHTGKELTFNMDEYLLGYIDSYMDEKHIPIFKHILRISMVINKPIAITIDPINTQIGSNISVDNNLLPLYFYSVGCYWKDWKYTNDNNEDIPIFINNKIILL